MLSGVVVVFPVFLAASKQRSVGSLLFSAAVIVFIVLLTASKQSKHGIVDGFKVK